MSKYIHFTKLKHLIFSNGGSMVEVEGGEANLFLGE
jgi:hypothetical protein